jgi:hypothetical protein
VCLAAFVQRPKCVLNIRINPCFAPVILFLGACGDHLGKGGIAGDAKPILPNGFGERFAYLQVFERNDRPPLRLYPIGIGIIARIRHRKHTVAIGTD